MSDKNIEVNSIVVAYLESPREKYFGIILSMKSTGIVLRGMKVESFEDWVREIIQGKGEASVSTFFFPWRRVEKLILDEDKEEVLSLSEIFRRRVGRSIRDFLL